MKKYGDKFFLADLMKVKMLFVYKAPELIYILISQLSSLNRQNFARHEIDHTYSKTIKGNKIVHNCQLAMCGK